MKGGTNSGTVTKFFQEVLLARLAACAALCLFIASGCGPAAPSKSGSGESSSRESLKTQGAQISTDPLATFLVRHTEFHLVTLEDNRVFKSFHRDDDLNATSKGDTNGDGREDIVATLVEVSGGKTTRSIAAFHRAEGGYITQPVWVVRNSEDSIFSAVASERRIDLIVCLDCDFIPVVRWSGESYETGIHLPQEQPCINPGAIIYAAADSRSSVVYEQMKGFGYVKVVELAGKTTHGSRWHKVRLLKPDSPLSENLQPVEPPITGFMDSTGFFDDVGC